MMENGEEEAAAATERYKANRTPTN
jgi:hypothetical protein